MYLNHQFTAPPTLLFGLKYTDPKSGSIYMQDRAGWVRPVGKGTVIYLMPSHSRMEFADPTYSRIVLNAVIY